jgi:Ser-tRNA(Ala) deacylase AlaX
MKIIVNEIVDKHLTLECTDKVEIDVDNHKEYRVKTFKTEVKLLKGSFERLRTAILTI